MENKKTLIVWFTNGGTAKFEEVTNFDIDSNKLKFEYFGVATQVGRKACFNFDQIAGWALEK